MIILKNTANNFFSMKYIFKALVLLLLVSTNAAAQVPAATIPDFKFAKQDKTIFTNKHLATGKTLFFVFFDTECDHCQRAMVYLNQHYQEFKKTAFYLITLDTKEKANLFMRKYGNNLMNNKNVTMLQDFQNEFITKFKPRKYPSLFLYSSDRKLILYDDNEQNVFKFLQQIKANAK
jgi:peroxiredoxin